MCKHSNVSIFKQNSHILVARAVVVGPESTGSDDTAGTEVEGIPLSLF